MERGVLNNNLGINKEKWNEKRGGEREEREEKGRGCCGV